MLSLLGTELFETVVSVPLIFEYEDVLARQALGIAEAAASDIIDYICAVSHRQGVPFLWRPFLNANEAAREFVARFPGRPPVVIDHLGHTADAEPKRAR